MTSISEPLLIRSVPSLQREVAYARERGVRVGLVPTMGALHEGHLTLIREAQKHAQLVVVTIFVNPTQFGPNEDLNRYPRDLEGDLKKCSLAGAHIVFSPNSPEELYPAQEETRVRVSTTAQFLEGEFRPYHFEGVATICLKLFQMVGPCVAIFGRKDYQQVQVIRRMVTDLFVPIEIVAHATFREPDGLAYSSRNVYLSSEERMRARSIALGLGKAVRAYRNGEHRVSELTSVVRESIVQAKGEIDYVACADPETMVPYASNTIRSEPTLLAVAARFGNTRLIDNVVLGDDPCEPFLTSLE